VGCPPNDADQETLAGYPLALIEALGADRAVLIGHDWGSAATYGAAALGPERVTKHRRHSASGTLLPGKLWGARHFATFKIPRAAKRFARNNFETLPAIYLRWSPTWNPNPEEFDAVRRVLRESGQP
jgi:pimeloyl-ACP methyl ester carboxylesterase